MDPKQRPQIYTNKSNIIDGKIGSKSGGKKENCSQT
jgi:hypothetical protein